MKFTANKFQLFFYVSFLATLLIASALRLPKLAQRPMHTDEAVHAIKFGALLENNAYTYDPHEYHGPTLVYSTLISAWLRGEKTLQQVDEVTLRLVPAAFGIGLILLLLGFQNVMRREEILLAALLTAVSPAFVFFSRYYIMEILLVFFIFSAICSGLRFAQTGKVRWAMLTGLSLALMHATKETFILSLAAIGGALILTMITNKQWRQLQTIKWRHAAIGLIAAIAVSVLFFSSFFTNPSGVIDSISAFATYIDRGAGGQTTHIYPWYQYFQWLFASQAEGGPLWSEGFVLFLALIGMGFIFAGRSARHGFWRFLAFYTVLLTMIYSIIPYKTPWSALGFYHGFILLAAAGGADLFRLLKSRIHAAKWIASAILIVAFFHLAFQSLLLNFRYESDPSNPYVYAHTDKDFLRMVSAIHNISDQLANGQETYIEVVCPNADYWPLPWYLRGYGRVGYFSSFDFEQPAGELIVTMPELQADLIKKLYEIPPPGQRDMYIPFFKDGIWLRPGVEIDLYVRKDIWDIWYRNSP